MSNQTRWLLEMIHSEGAPHYIAATADGSFASTTNPHDAMHFYTAADACLVKDELPLEVRKLFRATEHIFTER